MTVGPLSAIVSGASGIQGRALISKLVADSRWGKVYAISRKPDPALEEAGVEYITLDSEASKSKLKSFGIKPTHVFHLAFSGDTSQVDTTTATMLYTLVEGLEAAGAPLSHVYFAQGIKYYGIHLSTNNIKTPFREDDPRHLPPNFYYNMQDYAEQRVASGAKWSWSTLRPGAIVGYSPSSYMNLLHSIAVYGTLCKELNLGAMRFPGTAKAYSAVVDVADNEVVAAAQIWTSTDPGGKSSAFNVSNGDTFRWSEVWPIIAKWFGLPEGPMLRQPLAFLMPSQVDTWSTIAKKHGLHDYFPPVAQWEFMDTMLTVESDMFCDVTKLSRAGFNGQDVNTREMWIRKLNELVERKVIPPPAVSGKQPGK